ncbi:MAG: hypothetical protein J3K34DRAFT_447396, partial [Monoraphidium minutum]
MKRQQDEEAAAAKQQQQQKGAAGGKEGAKDGKAAAAAAGAKEGAKAAADKEEGGAKKAEDPEDGAAQHTALFTLWVGNGLFWVVPFLLQWMTSRTIGSGLIDNGRLDDLHFSYMVWSFFLAYFVAGGYYNLIMVRGFNMPSMLLAILQGLASAALVYVAFTLPVAGYALLRYRSARMAWFTAVAFFIMAMYITQATVNQVLYRLNLGYPVAENLTCLAAFALIASAALWRNCRAIPALWAEALLAPDPKTLSCARARRLITSPN